MPYYSNGGPGPATKLLRVDSPDGATMMQWRGSPAFDWGPKGEWKPNVHAQMDIEWLSEFFMIDASDVDKVQAEIRLRYDKFHTH